METITSFKIKSITPQLLVTDLNRAIKFYTEVLGFEIDFQYEDFYAGIIKDNYSIHLKHGYPNPEERKNKRQNNDLDLVIAVEEIELFYEAILNKSVEVTLPLRTMDYGKEFYILDPEGYILGFLANV